MFQNSSDCIYHFICLKHTVPLLQSLLDLSSNDDTSKVSQRIEALQYIYGEIGKRGAGADWKT